MDLLAKNMNSDSREIERVLALRELARRDFYTFFMKFYWPIVEPTTPFVESWAHRYVCEYLQALAENEIEGNSLLINTPPRFSKSSICTMAFPVWSWIRWPGREFLFASFNLKLSGKHARTRLSLLKDKRFEVLANIKLENNNPYSLDNSARGRFENLSRDKTTGSGATDLVIDDLCATTDTTNEIAKACDSYLRGIKSRLNNSRTDRKLMICQRVGMYDPAAVAEQEGYYKVCLEMESSRAQTFVFPRSQRTKELKAGDILNSARDSRAFIESLKLDEEVWATQYQQRPAPASGIIYTTSHFKETEDLRDGYIIVSVDSATSNKSSAAFWAIVVAHLSMDAEITILSVTRDQFSYSQGKQALKQVIDVWSPDFTLIEDQSSGQALLSELPEVCATHYVPIRPKGTKEARAIASVSMLPVFYFKGDWTAEYFNELLPFPRSATLDQVDATSQLLNWLRSFQQKVMMGHQLKLSTVVEDVTDRILAIYRDKVNKINNPQPDG